MLDKHKILSKFNKQKRKELKKALDNAYVIRKELETSLMDNYNDETLNKIIALNNIISDAEKIVNNNFNNIKEFYAKRFPEYVDQDLNINKKGIKRFINLNRILTNFKFLKK